MIAKVQAIYPYWQWREVVVVVWLLPEGGE
jgi:hypothetical protein